MGAEYVSTLYGVILSFFGSGSVAVDCDWCRKSFNKGNDFSSSRLFFALQHVPSPNKVSVTFVSLMEY